MTDAKHEALKQALFYHAQSMSTSIEMTERKVKKPSPQQVVATAKVFEAFLDPHRGK